MVRSDTIDLEEGAKDDIPRYDPKIYKYIVISASREITGVFNGISGNI